MDFATLSRELADRYPALSPRLQTAARHVMDRPDDVALSSMRNVAAAAGVHPSTMVRLARAMDFASYNEFRAAFQRRLRSQPADYLGRARQLQARGGEEARAVIADVAAAAVANMRDSFDTIGPERMIACAEALLAARRIFVAGRRSCYPIAFYFTYVYGMFRDNAVLLDGHGGTFADGLRGIGPGDVLVAASFNPYSQETVQAAQFTREKGGTSVALTDSLVSPLVQRAEHTLVINNESPSFFQSIAPMMVAVEALVAVMALKGGGAALDAIEKSERQLRRFEAYWTQGGPDAAPLSA